MLNKRLSMKKKLTQQQNTKEQGFTLIETLIAVIILIVSVVTPLSIASQAIIYSATARDQIIASNLAQEAIDFIRNERDRSALNTLGVNPARFQNFLVKFGSYTGPNTYCYATDGCAIDVQIPTYTGAGPVAVVKQLGFSPYNTAHVIDLATCTGANNCPFVSVNSLGASPTFVYGYANPSDTNWRESSFKRNVKMSVVVAGNSTIVNPQEVLVTVTMTWRTGSYDKTLTMSEYMKSWPDGVI
jgi:Tfp pilus assembly protein PilV